MTAWKLNRRFNTYGLRLPVFLKILEDSELIHCETTFGGVKCTFGSISQRKIDSAILKWRSGRSPLSRWLYSHRAVSRWKRTQKV